jgi:hypothetical protein
MKRKIDSLMGEAVYVDETALPVPEHIPPVLCD